MFVERCPECTVHPFPDWYDPGISLDDLPDAFKGCPVCIIAVWSEQIGKWLFAKSYSCLFGIGSVVVSVNRLPAVATAVSKRLKVCMCAAYLFSTSISKIFPVGPAPCLARRCAQFGDTQRRSLFSLQPKESSITQVVQGCRTAIARGSLTPAEAATLRGQAGWTATLSAGRFGRIGMHFLKTRQYQSHFESSTLELHHLSLFFSEGLTVLFFEFTQTRRIPKMFAPALAGCSSQTKLPHHLVTGTTFPQAC